MILPVFLCPGFRCGYGTAVRSSEHNQNYFYRQFREIYHCTPGEYRKKNRGGVETVAEFGDEE
jgi:hypothetical protein